MATILEPDPNSMYLDPKHRAQLNAETTDGAKTSSPVSIVRSKATVFGFKLAVVSLLVPKSSPVTWLLLV